MYQLSLRFTWKWDVEQGRAYKAVDIFRRELLRLTEDLHDPRTLLAWIELLRGGSAACALGTTRRHLPRRKWRKKEYGCVVA